MCINYAQCIKRLKQPNANKYAYDIVEKYLYLLFFDLKLSILCSSGVIPCALLTSMLHGSQYATLLPAFHPSTSSFSSKTVFSSKTEHWLQIGILHFKHSYFVFIKHEQHISILLELKCDVFNAFLRACLHGGGGPQVGEVTRLAVVEKWPAFTCKLTTPGSRGDFT